MRLRNRDAQELCADSRKSGDVSNAERKEQSVITSTETPSTTILRTSLFSAESATCETTVASPKSPLILPPGIKPYHQEDNIAIFCADCKDILPAIVSVDAIITDPPYNYGKKYGSHNDDMPEGEFWDWLEERFSLAAGVLRDGGVAYFTVSSQMMSRVERWPFLRFRQWLIWHRPNIVNAFGFADWKHTWEPIYYGGKGQFKAILGVFPDSAVFTIPTPQTNFSEGRDHITQKPVALMRAWLRRIDADLVLDPFMGSGTTLRAAKDLGRRAIGIEIEEKYCEIAAKRLSQEVMQF